MILKVGKFSINNEVNYQLFILTFRIMCLYKFYFIIYIYIVFKIVCIYLNVYIYVM